MDIGPDEPKENSGPLTAAISSLIRSRPKRSSSSSRSSIFIYICPLLTAIKRQVFSSSCVSPCSFHFFFVQRFFFFFYFLRPSHRGATYRIVPSSPHPNYGPSTTRPSFSQFVDDYDDNDNFWYRRQEVGNQVIDLCRCSARTTFEPRPIWERSRLRDCTPQSQVESSRRVGAADAIYQTE